jgi:hypothetical protein
MVISYALGSSQNLCFAKIFASYTLFKQHKKRVNRRRCREPDVVWDLHYY